MIIFIPSVSSLLLHHLLLAFDRVQSDDSEFPRDRDESLEIRAWYVHLSQVDELEQVFHLGRVYVLHEDDLVLWPEI